MHAVGSIEESMRKEVAVKNHVDYISKKLEAETTK
jgi:hypothetical protein